MTTHHKTTEAAYEAGHYTLLLDAVRGIYIPHDFALLFHLPDWGFSVGGVDVPLLAGPANEEYWEAWEEVLIKARHTDLMGQKWELHQNNDLFSHCIQAGSEEITVNLGE